MNVVLKILWEETVLDSVFLKINNVGGQNCAKVKTDDLYLFFWKSIVHSVKFRQMHVSGTIMATDNHVAQFPNGEATGRFLANNC